MTLKELQAKRGELHNAIKTLADKQATWTAEDRAAWDVVNKSYDDNKAALDAENKKLSDEAEKAKSEEAVKARLEALNADANAPVHKLIGRDNGTLDGRDDDKNKTNANELIVNAVQGWLLHGSPTPNAVNEKHISAAKATGNRLDSPLFILNLNNDFRAVRNSARLAVRNALSSQDGSSGGFSFGETFIGSLETAMLAFGGVFQVAEVIRTGTGEPMRWPTADDTANTGAQIGENPSSIGTTSDPTFGQVLWNAYTFTSNIVKVPNELLQDSSLIAANLPTMLGERLGRIQNTKFTTGIGVSTAKGIVTAAGSGVTSASSTAISFDEVIDLEHTIDPSRRNLPGVGYMFHDNTLKALRKLKDGEGRYLWQSGSNTGAPDTLNNRPYQVNQDMASSIASAAVTMLFGQLSQYKIRQVNQIVLRRLDERYADTNQVGFVAFVRGDGNLLDAGDHPVKKLTQV